MMCFPIRLTEAFSFFVENKVFIHSPRRERGMVWRDISALRGGGFELLLDYHWIKKGWGCCCMARGCWSVLKGGCGLFQCYLLPVAAGSVSSVLAFQSWGQAQESKRAVILNKVTGLLGKRGHNSKWG